MGELHLEIYVERMRREYNVECTTGKPRANFRETITQRSPFNYVHKKQTGGAGQYAKIIGYIEPMEPDPETAKDVLFENLVMGGNVPSGYMPAIEKVRCHVPGCSRVKSGSHGYFLSRRDSWKLYKRALSLATPSLVVGSS
jgi:translation elongation factor EF-G